MDDQAQQPAGHLTDIAMDFSRPFTQLFPHVPLAA
jgi:hypothetical protein